MEPKINNMEIHTSIESPGPENQQDVFILQILPIRAKLSTDK